MLGFELNTELRLKRLRLFLVHFVVFFFVFQPILNICFPEFAKHVSSIQDIEDIQEEEYAPDRTLEEEILHSTDYYYSFDQSELPLRKTNFVLYFYQPYFCAKADVNTPPPELIFC